MDYECLLFCLDWLRSDLRVRHFFSLHSSVVSTPQLNTQLLNSLMIELRLLYDYRTKNPFRPFELNDDSPTNELEPSYLSWVFSHVSVYNFGRTEQRSPPRTLSRHSVCCHGNVFTEPLLSNGLFRLSGVMSQYHCVSGTGLGSSRNATAWQPCLWLRIKQHLLCT
jgi:hypothetical protein